MIPVLAILSSLIGVSKAPVVAMTPSDDGRPALTSTATSDKIQLVVPAVDGQVRWRDVAAAMGDSMKLDARALEECLPPGTIDLRSDLVLLTLMSINLVASDHLSFDLVYDSDQRMSLQVTCERDWFASQARFKKPESVAFELDPNWIHLTAKRPLVICIHGLQGKAEAFEPMRREMRSRGFATAAIEYDDQQAIAVSAKRVAEIVSKRFREESHQPTVVLVGHSMGGLIAREWAENPDLDNESIVSLITLGTPHKGSAWATLPPMMDAFTSERFRVDDIVDVLLHTPTSPGLRDLTPGSDFLIEMATRPSRPDLMVTSIAGDGSPIPANRIDELQAMLRDRARRDRFVQLVRPRIAPLLDGFDELARGRGDGIVSVASATAQESDDIVVVDLSHFELVRPVPGRHSHPVWEVVLARLKQLAP